MRAEYRRRFASPRQKQDIRSLAIRLGVEPPMVLWVAEARETTKLLLQNLAHLQQPSLLAEQGTTS